MKQPKITSQVPKDIEVPSWLSQVAGRDIAADIAAKGFSSPTAYGESIGITGAQQRMSMIINYDPDAIFDPKKMTKGGRTKAWVVQKLGWNKPRLQLTHDHDTTKTRPQAPQIPVREGEALPIYVPQYVSEGGTKVMRIRRNKPISYAPPQPGFGADYIIIMTDNSMLEKFEPGDHLYVDTVGAPEIGKSCVFTHKDGETTKILKLISETKEAWNAKQLNPPANVKLDKAIWPQCHNIVGAYSPPHFIVE